MLLAPWALWFAIIGAAVVALYILKIRRQRRLVPSLDFWLALEPHTRARSLFRRLKRLISMLLWLAIVAALILALGNPLISASGIKPRSIAIILDNSASMHTSEGDRGTRFDLAREEVAKILAGRPVADEWLVIDAARDPQVICAWTRDKRAVLRAVEQSAPFQGSADPRTAIELAQSLVDGRSRPSIVVLSDGASGRVEAALTSITAALTPPQPPAGAPAPADQADESRLLAVHWPIGQAIDNLGITTLSVQLHRQQSVHHIFIRIESESDSAVQADLVLLLDGLTHAVEPVELQPGGSWARTLKVDAPAGGILEVRIDRPDVLAIDNTAFAVLDPIQPASVLLVTAPESAFFFEQALRAMAPLVSPEDSRVIAPDQYETIAAAGYTPDATIFSGWTPDTLPAQGSFICIGAVPRDVGAEVRGELPSPRLTVQAADHPLMRYLVLQSALIARAPSLTLPPGATTLATAESGDPLIFLAESPGRQILCIAFDVLESDLPVRNAFPILLRNAITHLSLDPPRWVASSHTIGEAIRPLRPIPDGAEVRLARLQGAEVVAEPVELHAGAFAIDPGPAPQALRIDAGAESAFTAVSLADASETRLAPRASPDFPAAGLPVSASIFGAPPWVVLAALAALLVSFEWVSFHMRWTE